VDVLACRAGATRTPGYRANQEERGGGSLPAPEMEPDAVVSEALRALGRTPSMVPGVANRTAAFFLSRILSRRRAVTIMGRSTRGMSP
jgi:hypothetical protein